MKSFHIAELLNLPNLKQHLSRIESELLSTLPPSNSTLREPIERLFKAPSKRLRSILVIASAGSSKQVEEAVIASCTAIELVHLGSLVHDDIMDESDIRWGIPTVNSKEGVNQAILVGDYLFAQANLVAAGIGSEIAKTIASAISKLCEGQATELAEVRNIDRSISSYLEAIRGKTGSLISASCRVGALCAGYEPARVKALSDFGESFGMAFQLIDDVLDVMSSPQLLGKPVGNDVVEGVYTMPMILALQGPHRKKMLTHLQNAATARSGSATMLVHEGYIRHTIKEAYKYSQLAKALLSQYENNGLEELPNEYLDWALEELVAN